MTAPRNAAVTTNRIRTPLSPCFHGAERGPVEVGFPRPSDAPSNASHTLEISADTLPALGSVVETVRHDYTGDKTIRWAVLAHGAPSRCLGANGTKLYHEPSDWQTVYVADVAMARLAEIRRCLHARGLDDTSENRAQIRQELGEAWLPVPTA